MNDLRNEVLTLVKKYYNEEFSEESFCPGETYIKYAGRVFDEQELVNLVKAFQKKNNLKPDGIIGDNTLKHMEK